MTSECKKLTVPNLRELDSLPLSEVADKLSEQDAAHSIDAVNWPELYSYKPITSFYIARGNKDLYLSFVVRGNSLRAVNSIDQQPVREDSCVAALFRDPQSGRVYDFAFNCIGTCAASVREQEQEVSWSPLSVSSMKSIRRFTNLGHRPFFEMEGLFNWQLTVAIPFSILQINDFEKAFNLEGNFYKCAQATSLPHCLSWSEIRSPYPDLTSLSGLGNIRIVSVE